MEHDQVAQIDRYCALLWDWNSKLNLTRHTDFDTFVSRDVVDSLELAKLLSANEEVLDVGSGGGVPGSPAGGAAGRPRHDDVRVHAEEGPRAGLHRERSGVAGSRSPLPRGTAAG